MSDSDFQVVWPLGRQAGVAGDDAGAAGVAPPLEHATVAMLWNYTRKGDRMFAIAKEVLGRQYPGMRFVDPGAFGDIHGADEPAVVAALPGKLAGHQVDYALVGVSG